MEAVHTHLKALSLMLLLILGVTVFERADTIAAFLQQDEATAAVYNPVSAFLGISDTQEAYTSTAEYASQPTATEASTLWGRIQNIFTTPTSTQTYDSLNERVPALLCVPSALTPGEKAIIMWACRDGATTTTSTGFDSDEEVVGTAHVTPTETTTYGIECIRDDEGVVTSTVASCTIRVVDAHATLTVTPSTAAPGTPVKVHWETTGTRACTLLADTDGTFSRTGIAGDTLFTPTDDTTLTLTCDDVTGFEVIKEVDITIE